MNSFVNLFDKTASLTKTENGGTSYSIDVLNPLARWMYTLSDTRRRMVRARINEKHSATAPSLRFGVFTDQSFATDVVNAVKAGKVSKEEAARFLVFARDPRNGVGERGFFRSALCALLDENIFSPSDVEKFIETIVNHGRWDDVVAIAETVTDKSFATAINLKIVRQLREDVKAMNEGKSVSLLAKWIPSINTSSKVSRAYARKIATLMELSEKSFRKMNVALRKKIDIVETKICANDYESIEYSKIPSLAMTRYSRMFAEKDGERYRSYLADVKAGKVKINASVVTPPELFAQYVNKDPWIGKVDVAEEFEPIWNAMPSVEVTGNVLPVIDMSGSMYADITSNVKCIDVSVSMGLYVSQHNTGAFKDRVMLFGSESSTIKFHDYDSLGEKIKKIFAVDIGYSTNVKSALMSVLKIAIESKCSQTEIPTLLFITDSEFNAISNANSLFGEVGTKSDFEVIAEEYGKYGYSMPKIVFWNTACRSGSVPLTENENGLILLSGFSPNVLKMVESGNLDPTKAVLEIISKPEFDDAVNLC